jgi:crotonobetainyl-CoA hydratase
MSAPAVLFDAAGHVATITVNRPHAMNAIDADVVHGLHAAFDRLAADAGLWVGIVTGAGDRAFCAGADLKAAAVLESQDADFRASARGLLRRKLDKPLIAAVNGFALGGGMELALFCDLIVAAETATFGLPEVRRGLLAAGGGLVRLPRAVPLKVAAYHAMTGEAMSAAEALGWGLVNKVVPAGQLLPAALGLAQRLCDNAPVSVRESRNAIYQAVGLSLDRAWEISDACMERNRATDDAREGPLAFAQKRPPVWKGC